MTAFNYYISDYTKSKSREESIFQGKKYRITVLSDLLIRLEYNENGTFEDRPTELAIDRFFDPPHMEVSQTDQVLNIKTSYFKLYYLKESNMFKPNNNNLKIQLVNTEKEWTLLSPEVRNFFGSTVSLDDVNGRVPLLKGLFSADGYVSIDDSKSLIFNEEGTLVKNNNVRIDKYVFMYRKDFGSCLRDYYKLTGKPPMIPRYALGIWWNRNIVYKATDIRDLIDEFHRHEIPFSVLLLGENWHIRTTNTYKNLMTGYSFNRELFPKPDEFVKYVHSKDLYLGLKINPEQGIMSHEEHYPEIATAMNKTDGSAIPFNTFDPNFLKIYFTTIINPLYKLGVNFFWLDYYNKNNLTSLRAINHYYYINSISGKERRGIILSRNGLTAAHRYPIDYSGQTRVSWDVLKFLPEFNSSASNDGIAWWSHDIGGYKDGMEDPELYTRYVQLGTFSPIFRFSCKEGKYYKREPWAWEVKIETIVREYTRLRHQLIPYLYTEGRRYFSTGLPFIQPLYYKYPETYDDDAFCNEYFFGSELFVSPITKKIDTLINRVVERTYIPKGLWYEFKSGKKVPGDHIYRLFYKESDYPVFAKSGAIIPLAVLDEKRLNYTGNPTNFEVHIFPGSNNTYRMYEDDGISNGYIDGEYLITEFKYHYQVNNFTLNIRASEGKSGIVPEKRSFKIRFRNTKYPQKLEVRVGNNLTTVPSYTDGKDFIVDVPFVKTYDDISILCSGNDIEIDAAKLLNEDVDDIITDLIITTDLKEKLNAILFSTMSIQKKRIEIRKLKKDGLSPIFVKLFIRFLEYLSEI